MENEMNEYPKIYSICLNEQNRIIAINADVPNTTKIDYEFESEELFNEICSKALDYIYIDEVLVYDPLPPIELTPQPTEQEEFNAMLLTEIAMLKGGVL